jgi:hypothetical protein
MVIFYIIVLHYDVPYMPSGITGGSGISGMAGNIGVGGKVGQ